MRLILIRARDFHIGAIPPPAVVSRTTPTSITPVESALMQLFILKNFKSRRMNTYRTVSKQTTLTTFEMNTYL